MKKCSHCGTEYPDDALVCATDHTPLEAASPVPEQRHSGLGIASFAIAIGVGALMMLVLCAAGVLAGRRAPGEPTYPGQTIIGLLIICLTAGDAVAAGLGIAALCQKGKKRVFAILGVVFSGATVVGVVGLIIIGLAYMNKVGR